MSSRRVILATGFMLPATLVVGGILVVGSMLGGTQDTAGCEAPTQTTDLALASRVGGLTSSQLANAGAVIAAGNDMGIPARGVVVALAVANQESHFTNYANDGQGGDLASSQRGIGASQSLPHEAVGTDHGSLGIFQQQWPWWGSMRDLMTPGKAAEKFYQALLKVPGWQQMPLTRAAQTVQRSALPDAYADDEPLARQLVGLSSRDSLNTAVASAGMGGGASPSCAAGGMTATGSVVFPLPSGSKYRDNHNFGRAGGRWASVHTGDDLSVACGTPVLAATAGTVVIRADQPWAGPRLVQVSTGTGRLTTWYAHMRSVSVQQGQTVTAGQRIGEVGDLGNATGCHLHFEVHPRGGSIYQDDVDPSVWLNAHVGRELGGGQVARQASWSGSGAAFTVATFNVLGDSHTRGGGEHAGMASGPVRMRGAVRLLNTYAVDVAGLQELQRPQATAFTRLAGGTYALWWPPGESPENAIAYRRDRFNLTGTGSVVVPYFNGHARHMPVLRLEDRVTGAQTTFVNVHNPADTRKFRRQGRWRTLAVTREAGLIRSLSGQTPVILTGDLNDRRSAFCRLSSEADMSSSNGGSGSPCRPAPGAGIDWILGSPGVRFSDHTRVRSALVRATTDHPLVMSRVLVAP